MKYLVLVAFLFILGSLAAALFFMLRKDEGEHGEKVKSSKMAWALAVRIGLSIVLFASILLAWKLGYIHPTGIPAGA